MGSIKRRWHLARHLLQGHGIVRFLLAQTFSLFFCELLRFENHTKLLQRSLVKSGSTEGTGIPNTMVVSLGIVMFYPVFGLTLDFVTVARARNRCRARAR